MLKSGYDAVLHPLSSVTMLLKHKDGPGAAAPLTVKVVVTLSGRGPESVTLTVETQGPMTLVWPAFGGLFAGKAVGLTKIERVSPAAAAGSAAQAPNMLGSLRKRLGRSGRVDPEPLSRSPSHTEEAHEAAGVRDATMEDVHAMVMALVDRELSECEVYDGTDSLFTLRDSSGAMLVHNLLLAGAQGKDPRAHKLFLEIVHKVPRLLLDVHDGKV